ncbi:MAG: aminotransferase class I/II-fold pyridoxal phosphate-dependent enzyme [Candidatus Kariarchaeaceae archaeon]
MNENPVGLGAYSQSAGMPFIRQAVADFISQRDNISASADNIFLTDGASKGVDLVLSSIIMERVGIMIPIPQYPLYSADISLFGGTQVPYFLDENNGWELNKDMLEKAYTEAAATGVDVKLLVVINPNNPTGSVLSRRNIEMVLKFAKDHKLMILADEVYQENVYEEGDAFYSFASVADGLGIEIPIFSLHSTSKGYFGECGLRGGYIEMRNVPEEVRLELLKVRSIGLCSNTVGQIATYLMINPPKKGDPSFELYKKEKDKILASMKRKASIIANALDAIEGISCPTPRGAMYLFPKLDLPEIEDSPADFAFAKFLVEETGIVTVPGSGFGQLPGTWHLRMTFLPPEDKIPDLMTNFKQAYQKFIQKS